MTPSVARPTARPDPLVGLGLLVGILAISSSAILARVAMGEAPGIRDAAPGAAPALAVAFWRTLGGSIALTPLALRDRGRAGTATRAGDRRWLAVSGLALAFHFALFQGSLALTSVASSVTLATASPVFVAVGSWWLLSERPSRRVWLGMTLTVAGAATIGIADISGHGLGPRALTGDAMALGSAAAMSGYLLVGRAVRGRVAAGTYSAVVYAWSALGLGVLCLALGVPLVGYTPTTWLALAGIVVGPQLLGHTVFNTLLSRVSATVIAVAVLAEPVGAGTLAWLLLDELPATGFWVGAPLVLTGVAVAAVRRTRSTTAAGSG